MPQAVTHVLIALILADIIRDYIIKDKRKFPLHYVLIAGIAGLLPDIDIVIFWIMNLFTSITVSEVHRVFTHSFIWPALFLIIASLTKNIKVAFLGKHKLRLNWIFYMLALGMFTHIILDSLFAGLITPFWPFSAERFGIGLIKNNLDGTLLPGLDAILLIGWLVHEELKHRISDFI
jgi:membrane-bound metal-dependent hydrolase YbcI (DUF457 family)